MDSCPICFENLTDTDYCVTICKHNFCIKCITNAIETNDKCPCCRSLIVVSSYKKDDYKKQKYMDHLEY
jgi:hypothetical protein